MLLLPGDVKKALDLLTADLARQRSIAELAAECGVARRTLQKHFRRFLGRTPGEVLRDLRLERVRHEMLQAPPGGSVTESAMRYGIGHLGRFSAAYSRRYGETPSATLRRRRQVLAGHKPAPTILSPTLDRPVSMSGPSICWDRRRNGPTRLPTKSPLLCCATAGSQSARSPMPAIGCTGGSATTVAGVCGPWLC